MFENIIALLNSHFSNNWFLDSGSLLGIIRDKHFLKSDLGIDISVICDQFSKKDIDHVVKQLERYGFVVSEYQWEGNTYKYCFVPKTGSKYTYGFDLHLFKKNGTIGYCCPQISIKQTNSFIINSLRGLRKGNALIRKSGFLGTIKYSIGYLYRDVFKYFGAKMNMSKYAREGGKTLFWVIPFHMLHGVETGVDGFNVLVNPDAYLTYRYGNWRVPVSDWVTLRDDGGLVPCDYKDISAFMNEFWK